MSTRPESLSLCLPYASSPISNSEVSCSHFSLAGFLPCPLARNVHSSPLCGAYHFPAWAGGSCGHCRRWGGPGVGMRQGETGEEEVSWVLAKTCRGGWDGHCFWTHRDRQDGFPPATSPWAASGLEGGTGERGKEMPDTFTLLPGASPSLLPLSLSSDLSFPHWDQAAS